MSSQNVEKPPYLKPIMNMACGYCIFFHYTHSYGLYERNCKMKDRTVNARSPICKHYKPKKYYFCPLEKQRVTSVMCIALRQCGGIEMKDHMLCGHFPTKLQLIRRKK